MLEQLVLFRVSLSVASSSESVKEGRLDSSNSDKVVVKLKSSQTLDLSQAVIFLYSIVLSKCFRKILFLKFERHYHISILSFLVLSLLNFGFHFIVNMVKNLLFCG